MLNLMPKKAVSDDAAVAVVEDVLLKWDRAPVLQCVAVRCSVLQCVAVCYSMLQYVAVCCSVLQCVVLSKRFPRVAVCCSVLQCAAV